MIIFAVRLPFLVLLKLEVIIVILAYKLVLSSIVSEAIGIHEIYFCIVIVPGVGLLKRVFMGSVRLIDSLIILLG